MPYIWVYSAAYFSFISLNDNSLLSWIQQTTIEVGLLGGAAILLRRSCSCSLKPTPALITAASFASHTLLSLCNAADLNIATTEVNVMSVSDVVFLKFNETNKNSKTK